VVFPFLAGCVGGRGGCGGNSGFFCSLEVFVWVFVFLVEVGFGWGGRGGPLVMGVVW